jgi:ribosomal protein S1
VLGTDRTGSERMLKLSTKHLEASPGDMMRDTKSVYANAEKRAAKFSEHMAALEVYEYWLCMQACWGLLYAVC